VVGSVAAECCGAYEAMPLSAASIPVGENLRVNSEFYVAIQAGRSTAACTSAGAAGPIDLLAVVLVAATAHVRGVLSSVNGPGWKHCCLRR
jgi:hypothetical protein